MIGTYNYSTKDKDFETLKNDYLLLLKRSIHQKAFDEYTDANLEKIISTITNIPSSCFKVIYREDYRDYKKDCCLRFKIEAKNDSDNFSIKLNTHSDIFNEVKKCIYQSYRTRIISYGYYREGENPLDVVKNWEKELTKIREDFEKIDRYIEEKKSDVAVSLFTMKANNFAGKVIARDNRLKEIYELESALSDYVNSVEPEVGEKVYPSWLENWNLNWHITNEEDEEDLNNYCIFLSKEGEYFHLKTQDGKKKKVKNVRRYLPNVKGFEELKSIKTV